MSVKTLYKAMELEADTSKPGRELVCQVLDDLGAIKTVYLVRLEPGGKAGNHFHEKKFEILFCIHGRVMVHLVDKDDPTRVQSFGLSENEGTQIHPGVAHLVECIENAEDFNPYHAIVQVFSTGFPRTDDDHEFDVMAAVQETAN